MTFLDRTFSESPAAPVREFRIIRAPGGSASQSRGLEQKFQRGMISYHRGDYSKSLNEFEAACTLAHQLGNYSAYVEGYSFILRILAEREEFSKINQIENSVLQILSQPEGSAMAPSLKSRALYVLGICHCYQDTRHDLAMTRFREAIDYAMMSGDKTALASPLYGAATVLYARHRYEDAARELDRLTVLTSCLHLPDLATASHLLRAMIRRNQGHFDEALESAWKAFDSLKHHPHLVLYLHTLCVLGEVFTAKGDPASARLYLDLASRSLKREELRRITRLIDEAMAALGVLRLPEADLVFDSRTGLLQEKAKGEIHFEGQFILRDLLKVFLESPGRIFGKEELALRVWREPYEPKIHDNKIYVTIKRLRQLLESEDGKAKYIMRAKTGYFLNPKIRVVINENQQPTGEAVGLTENKK